MPLWKSPTVDVVQIVGSCRGDIAQQDTGAASAFRGIRALADFLELLEILPFARARSPSNFARWDRAGTLEKLKLPSLSTPSTALAPMIPQQTRSSPISSPERSRRNADTWYSMPWSASVITYVSPRFRNIIGGICDGYR